jgi:hypothetical protein
MPHPSSNFFRAICFLAVSFATCMSSSAQSALGQLLQPQAPASASSKTPVDSLGRETPYGTVFGFLEAAQSGNYGIADQYLQLTPARRQYEGETLARQLKAVMDSAFAGSLKNVSTRPEGTPQEGVPTDRQELGTMSSGDVEGSCSWCAFPILTRAGYGSSPPTL